MKPQEKITKSKWEKLNSTDQDEKMAKVQPAVTSSEELHYFPLTPDQFKEYSDLKSGKYGNGTYGSKPTK